MIRREEPEVTTSARHRTRVRRMTARSRGHVGVAMVLYERDELAEAVAGVERPQAEACPAAAGRLRCATWRDVGALGWLNH